MLSYFVPNLISILNADIDLPSRPALCFNLKHLRCCCSFYPSWDSPSRIWFGTRRPRSIQRDPPVDICEFVCSGTGFWTMNNSPMLNRAKGVEKVRKLVSSWHAVDFDVLLMKYVCEDFLFCMTLYSCVNILTSISLHRIDLYLRNFSMFYITVYRTELGAT